MTSQLLELDFLFLEEQLLDTANGLVYGLTGDRLRRMPVTLWPYLSCFCMPLGFFENSTYRMCSLGNLTIGLGGACFKS